jgi:hypothetical protein
MHQASPHKTPEPEERFTSEPPLPFRVPGSMFRVRVHSSNGTPNLEPRTLKRNPEQEPGTGNSEPGTALYRRKLMTELVFLGLEVPPGVVAGGNFKRNGF